MQIKGVWRNKSIGYHGDRNRMLLRLPMLKADDEVTSTWTFELDSTQRLLLLVERRVDGTVERWFAIASAALFPVAPPRRATPLPSVDQPVIG